MKELCKVRSDVKHAVMEVSVVEWCSGDPFPVLGASVGVDTETELITDTVLFPKLVVLGVFDPAHAVCYIVYYDSAADFMRQLCSMDVQQRYFNLGFDEGVLDNEDDSKALLDAIECGRVRDMQIRVHLNEIATVGYIRGDLYSLAGCSMSFLGKALDKGDGTEDSARLSFRRGVPITEEQARYLPFDCITTWALGEEIQEQPIDPVSGLSVEVGHTKGMCVLAHITANGFAVDPVVADYLRRKLSIDRDGYREALLAFGFPDPYRDDAADRQMIERMFSTELARFSGVDGDYPVPGKAKLRLMLVQMWNHDKEPEEIQDMRRDVLLEYKRHSDTMRKDVRALWDDMLDTFRLEAFDSRTKKIIMPAYVAFALHDLNEQLSSDSISSTGLDASRAFNYAGDELDKRIDWMSIDKPIGPRKFFQEHVKALLLENSTGGTEAALAEVERRRQLAASFGQQWTDAAEMDAIMDISNLKLEQTEKSGDVQLTLKDLWRLEDMDIHDKFMDAYTRFNHCVKYLSTYLDPKYVKEDGKVHPRFTNILRTGRTSCTNPNIQNLPSRDKVYPLKYMYCPPKGAVLCATDFSFVELCGFGQNCYTKYKDYEKKGVDGRIISTLKDVEGSVMRKVINAGLDPHRWFAGVMNKVIDPDLSRANEPDWIQETKAFLKEHVTDAQRQSAKMANFGLPGGLSENSFFIHCREGGLKLTPEDAKIMRDAWISTFREMDVHMNTQKPADGFKYMASQFGIGGRAASAYADDEEAERVAESDRGGKLYKGICINGMTRNNASRNAAANMAFQGLVAYGAKLAGWNLVYNGYGDRLCNFVHDEYLYWLWPDELEYNIPIIEKLMLAGMAVAIPDVKVGCETTCCLHWDKKAKEFASLEKDEDGSYLIEEPEFVANIYKELSNEEN